METIRVNMTPCDEVKTIHASQNDGEAREWGFELHNNGEKIDSSSISDQMVFKSYENGTEEILPTNGSTPTTSPIIADIKYPQGLLTDQDFLYRESPTEEDGLAWIKNIKGNTLVWNQLVKNGNFASTSGWKAANTNYGTISASGNILIYTVASQQAGPYNYRVQQQNDDNLGIPVGHKLYIALDFKPSEANEGSVQLQSSVGALDKAVLSFAGATPNAWSHLSTFFTTVRASQYIALYLKLNNPQTVGATFQFKNFMIVDLTAMFGAGNEPTTVEEFKSLFPLSYYSYNQGSLLSFNGTGIKTVGKNLASGISQGAVGTNGQTTSNEKRLRVNDYVRVFQGEHYTFTAKSNSGKTLQIYTRYFADADGSEQVSYLDWLNLPRSIIIPSGVNYATFTIRFGNNDNIALNDISDVQVEHGASATSYEPYTSSTLSLPISTYFPTGMKSAGNVYDELTENKASERVGSMTLDGSQSASVSIVGSYTRLSVVHGASNVKYPNTQQESNYLPYVVSFSEESNHFYANDYQAILIMQSSVVGTTVDSFNSYLQSHPLTIYYELATETETDIESASLVTENGETPLSNEDGVLIGKCTEQLSSESGFIDAKIKLADADGECYSNKIQLHIERSPQ